jgi:WD40 repeat protein
MNVFKQPVAFESLALGIVLWLSICAAAPQEPNKPAADKPKLDAYGDPLPPGAIARLGTLRMRHQGWVDSVLFSPDGTKLASMSKADQCVRLWDVATGKELERFDEDSLGSLAFSHDGKWLATGKGTGVIVREVATGKRHRLAGCSLVAYSCDNKTLVGAGADGRLRGLVRLWKADTGEEISVFDGFDNPIQAIMPTPEGPILAAEVAINGKDETIRVWELPARREVLKVELHDEDGLFGRPHLAPNGRLLVAANDDGLRMWDLPTGQEVMQLKHGRPVAFSADSTRFVWGTPAHALIVTDLLLKKDLQVVLSNPPGITCGAISDDGKTLATGNRDRTISLYRVSDGKSLLSFHGHRTYISSLAFSPKDNNLLATGGGDGTVRLWEPRTGRELRVLQLQCPPGHPINHVPVVVSSVAFSPSGNQLAAACDDRIVRVWNTGDWTLQHELKEHTHITIKAVAFSADGKMLASGDYEGLIIVWDPVTGMPLRRLRWDLPYKSAAVLCLAFAPKGNLLASGGADRIIRFWDTVAGKETNRFDGLEGRVTALAFSPDGGILASAEDRKPALRLWDLNPLKQYAVIPRSQDYLISIAFSRDGSKFVSLGQNDPSVRFWNINKGEEVFSLLPPPMLAGPKASTELPLGSASRSTASCSLLPAWIRPF